MWFRKRNTPKVLDDLRRGYFPAKLIPVVKDVAQRGFDCGMSIGDALFVPYAESYFVDDLKLHPEWPKEWRALIGTPELRAIIAYQVEVLVAQSPIFTS